MRNRTTIEPNLGSLGGVGGWLLVLCIILTVVAPLLVLLSTLLALEQSEAVSDVYPGFTAIMRIASAITLLAMILSFYAGSTLWRLRPNAVARAKRVLFQILGLSVVSAIVLSLSDLPSGAYEEAILSGVVGVVRTGIFVGVWYLYLCRSSRVAATYPEENNRGSA